MTRSPVLLFLDVDARIVGSGDGEQSPDRVDSVPRGVLGRQPAAPQPAGPPSAGGQVELVPPGAVPGLGQTPTGAFESAPPHPATGRADRLVAGAVRDAGTGARLNTLCRMIRPPGRTPPGPFGLAPTSS
ncbi:hypothetical protein GCM10027589_17130 [Actinocorallia lasiicapitis]